jgi:hypothetical protein
MPSAPELLSADPREYFKYSACATCRAKPCNDMRFAAFRQGDFILVHNRDYAASDPCPFAAASFSEAEILLKNLPLHRLDLHIQ